MNDFFYIYGSMMVSSPYSTVTHCKSRHRRHLRPVHDIADLAGLPLCRDRSVVPVIRSFSVLLPGFRVTCPTFSGY